MSKADRSGKRKSREQFSKRVPRLGYYFIVTDTKETEQNYMYGLRDSIPQSIRGNLVIKVVKSKTVDLVNTAISLAALNPQYGEVWIVFDRDEVKDFDEIIARAERTGIHVGWSNPCVEIWFHAYFGSMPSFQTSVACCNGFEECYRKHTGKKYVKSDSDIYHVLCSCGDEVKAARLAEQRLVEHIRNGKFKPSKMIACTTVHRLVDEIVSKKEDCS